MTTLQPEDGQDLKIVTLTVAEDQEQASALACYWDATMRGQTADASVLDPELVAVVGLLRHYHAVTRLPHDGSAGPDATASEPGPIRPIARAALPVIAVLAVIFALHTLLSPRSWLLSSAEDPDWIPWVSDDWLGADAVTAYVLDSPSTGFVDQHDQDIDGA